MTLALLLAAVLALPAQAPVVEERIVGGQFAVIVSPPKPTDRVVIVAHGAGHSARSMLNDIEPVTDELLARGYTIAASDAHFNAWGNRASRRDYIRLARLMRDRGLRRVYVLARSMGGLATLGALPRLRPEAWAGIYPACHIGSLRRYAAGIGRAWGRPFWYLHGLARLNPLRIRGVAGMPMIFWASYGDTVVRRALNTDRCAEQAERAGARVTVVDTVGDHGHPSNMQPQRLADFFDDA